MAVVTRRFIFVYVCIMRHTSSKAKYMYPVSVRKEPFFSQR